MIAEGGSKDKGSVETVSFGGRGKEWSSVSVARVDFVACPLTGSATGPSVSSLRGFTGIMKKNVTEEAMQPQMAVLKIVMGTYSGNRTNNT